MNESRQIDKEEFKKCVLDFFDRLREAEMELLLYRSMVEALRTYFGDVIVKMESKIRENPATKKTLDEYRDEHRRQVVDAVEEGFRYHAVLRFLQEWKASGPIN